MLVNVISSKTNKKDAIRYIQKKTPLISKIEQFNRRIEDVAIQYIELKILSYEVVSKEKGMNLFRSDIKKHNITMMINTYNGYSESIDEIPETSSRYIAKSHIKKSTIEEDELIEKVKDEIIYFLRNKLEGNKVDKLQIQNIVIKEIKQIYKPYWITTYNGKTIYVEA